MPNYWNSGIYYQPAYQGMSGYSAAPYMQQSYAMPVQSNIAAAWVEGEMEARGRQMPAGVTQYFMFDANNQKIYLKSINQMGMPNPMQILNFTIEGQQQNLISGQSQNGMNYSGYSGENNQSGTDMSQFATKKDFEQLRNEIRQMNQSSASGNNGTSNTSNTSGQNNGGNRGGNR